MAVAKQAWPAHLPYKRNSIPPLASNSTKCCTHLMTPSDQLSSPMDSSLSHLQHQQVTTVSLFQLSWIYKQATFHPVYSVLPPLLPRQQLLLSKSSPHHCLLLLDVPYPDEKTLFLKFLSYLPRGRKSLLRKSACSVPEAPYLPTKRLQVVTSQVCPVPVFIPASCHPLVVQLLALASLNCDLVPHFPLRIGRSCGMVLAPLCGTSPCSCELGLASLATWCHFIK